ncbi:MAG: dTDP-glucose 4,6-dehydratase [Xanthobacteraceae bacterium]
MRIIVTGGAGFIGSAVCRLLIGQESEDVLNVDKLTYAGNLEALREIAGSPRYRFERVDICDRPTVDALFADFKPQAMIHLAAESHVDRSIDESSAFVDTNVVGTLCLLESARRYLARVGRNVRDDFRFVHVSTDEVYGSLGPAGRFTETTAYDPRSPYAATKAAADHLARAWHSTYGIPTIISNSSNNYGPYHFPEKLVPLAILNAIEDKPIPVYGDGSNIRDWLHVDDHARALYRILMRGRPGEKYNVGADSERSNIAVVSAICDCLDRLRPAGAPHKRLLTFVEDRPGHDRRYAIDARKLRDKLGWRAEVSFDAGLETTVQWYLTNDWWWRPLRQAYAGERLGLADCRSP